MNNKMLIIAKAKSRRITKKDQLGATSTDDSRPSASSMQTASGQFQILPTAERFWKLLHTTGELHDPSKGFCSI